MTQVLAPNYLKEVRAQYENYPYPVRDPAREKHEFYYTPQDALDGMNYYHFGGKRDFTKGFRALSAGGGTGDAVIMLAEQCRDFKADIIYLDMTESSMRVAQARAKARGLTNITWVHGSLLDAPKLVEGKFDYIECSGVLHHLAVPEDGLRALASLLKDDGVMGLMLYAKYGRQAVYQVQKLLKILNQGEEDMQRKVDNCKALWNSLRTNPCYRSMEQEFSMDFKFGDIGMYDLFLHSQDVAYSVPDVYNFLSSAGLTATHFFSQGVMGNDLYRLEAYAKDISLSAVFARLSSPEKQAAAELINGKMIKHIFYAAKAQKPLPSPEHVDNIPCFSMVMKKSFHADIAGILDAMQAGQEVNLALHGREVKFVKTPYAAQIFHYLDGNHSLREIFAQIRSRYAATEKKPSMETLKQEFEHVFLTFNRLDWMFLRDKSSSPALTVSEIQDRIPLDQFVH